MDAIDKINYFLAQKGMTGADLERKIGVSNSVYSQWNTKTTKPSKKSLVKVAQVLEVDVIQILPDKVGQKENPSAPTSEGRSSKDDSLIRWFRSLPPEKQKAILIAQDGPIDAAD